MLCDAAIRRGIGGFAASRREAAISVKQFFGNPVEVFLLKFYFNGSPNPSKVALFLEEAGLPY